METFVGTWSAETIVILFLVAFVPLYLKFVIEVYMNPLNVKLRKERRSYTSLKAYLPASLGADLSVTLSQDDIWVVAVRGQRQRIILKLDTFPTGHEKLHDLAAKMLLLAA